MATGGRDRRPWGMFHVGGVWGLMIEVGRRWRVAGAFPEAFAPKRWFSSRKTGAQRLRLEGPITLGLAWLR